jgi:hypothetical protein
MSRLGVLPARMALCATVVVSAIQSDTVYVTNERSLWSIRGRARLPSPATAGGPG